MPEVPNNETDPSSLVEQSDPPAYPTPTNRPDQFWCDVADELVQSAQNVRDLMLESRHDDAYEALRMVISGAEQLLGPLGPNRDANANDNASGHFTDMPG